MENWFAGFAERDPVFPGLMEAAVESVGAGLCHRPLSWGEIAGESVGADLRAGPDTLRGTRPRTEIRPFRAAYWKGVQGGMAEAVGKEQGAVAGSLSSSAHSSFVSSTVIVVV